MAKRVAEYFDPRRPNQPKIKYALNPTNLHTSRMFRSAIVVCTANICRSPMAEGLFRSRVPHCTVSSAGVAALAGRSAALYAKQTMLAHGYDISAHFAQQATRANLGAADLIIAVDSTHVDWINRNFPQFRGRVHKLGKWEGDIDIPDPYGGSAEDFESAFRLIADCTDRWVPYLQP